MLIVVNGDVKRIVFNRAIVHVGGAWGCKFVTEDKAIQKAIESHKDFNATGINKVWTDDVEPVEQSVEETIELTPDTITTLKDAKEYIVKNFGVDSIEVSTKAKVLAFAAEHNFQFKNL